MNLKLPEDTITMENIEQIYDYVFAPYVKQLKLSFLSIFISRIKFDISNILLKRIGSPMINSQFKLDKIKLFLKKELVN